MSNDDNKLNCYMQSALSDLERGYSFCLESSHDAVVGTAHTAPLKVNEAISILEFGQALAEVMRRFKIVSVDVCLTPPWTDDA